MHNIHKSVVRNQGYTRGAVEHIERHNERKNTNYSNIDVVLKQSDKNIKFKECDSTYLGAFDKMVQNGEISTRGLKLNDKGTKKESNIIGELVFDVNTEYFDTQYTSHGYTSSYDFAKAFYAEAYKMAVEEVGNEKYILSATMHADERNKGLSEQLGRDVYHYHLHVVYIPIVQKEIKWTKKCKDKSLIGKVKEIINQVSHSKKWECEKVIGENNKEHLEYSYSKLQDRYHNHMKAAGFDGFERGKVGSTAEYLSVLDYKTKVRQEELAEKEKALAVAEKELVEKCEALAVADEQLIQKKIRFEKLSKKEIDIQRRIKSIEDSGQILTLKQVEKINGKIHAPLVGQHGIIITNEEYKNLKAMALTAAKTNEETQRHKCIARAAIETIRDIIQTVGLLKFNFKENGQPVNNLTPEQEVLITAIRKLGIDISRSHGYNKLADEMKKATMSKSVSEIFHGLEKEYHDKNKSSINEILQAGKLKIQEQNEKNNNAPNRNQGRKSHGAEL